MKPMTLDPCRDTFFNIQAKWDIMDIHSAKKFLDTYKSFIFTRMLHIRQIKSLLCKAGECPFNFDTKLEEVG